MKRVAGLILIALGAFLLVVAGLLKFYAVPQLAQAPLSPGEDTGGISVTLADGTAVSLLSVAALAAGDDPIRRNVPIVNTRNTRGDVPASESDEAKDNNIAVYDSFTRTTDPEDTVVTAQTIRVAFDRRTSELSNCCGANVGGEDAPFAGINPLKFPFFVEKKSYDYFDTTLLQALPMEFVGEEDLLGMTAYKFVQNIPPTQYTVLEVPGTLVGSEESVVEGGRFYSNVRTTWVDPITGAVLKGFEQQKQTLRVNGEDRLTLLEANVGWTDEQVKKTVEDTQSSANLLNLLNSTIPLVALILGVLALVGGILLARAPKEDEEYATGGTGQWDQSGTA